MSISGLNLQCSLHVTHMPVPDACINFVLTFLEMQDRTHIMPVIGLRGNGSISTSGMLPLPGSAQCNGIYLAIISKEQSIL